MELLDRPTMIKMLETRMQQLSEMGNDDVQRIDKELKRTPDDAELWFELGLAYNQSGLHYQDMVAELERLRYIEAHPDEEGYPEGQPEAESPEANVLYESALAAFDKVQELMPDYYGLQCQRGVTLGNMRRYEEAERCYLKALEEDEEDFTAAYYLACVYRDMGDEERAGKYFALAQELNGEL